MIRHLRLRRRPCLVLMLAVATSSGCINSDKFTSGRLPYGAAGGLAAKAPHDPFLTGSTAQPNERHVASTAPMTQPMNDAAAASVPTNPAQNYAAIPSGASQMQASQMQASQMQASQMQASQMQPPQMQPPQMQPPQMQPPQMQPPQMQPPQMQASQMQAPQYAMHAAPAAAPITDTRQAAYTPSGDNPFNTTPSALPVSQPMPSQMPTAPTDSAIEQISFEMPVGMPAESHYEENPFAEVQGQPIAAHQTALPQIQPMHGTTDAWQPGPTSPNSFAGNDFLPPQ